MHDIGTLLGNIPLPMMWVAGVLVGIWILLVVRHLIHKAPDHTAITVTIAGLDWSGHKVDDDVMVLRRIGPVSKTWTEYKDSPERREWPGEA